MLYNMYNMFSVCCTTCTTYQTNQKILVKCHEPYVSAIECNPVMYKHLQMTETTWTLQVSKTIVVAIYLGVSQIQCELPNSNQSYEVSFSNNGISYGSTKIILLNYDPVCVACNFANRTCAPRVCRMVYFLLCLVDYRFLINRSFLCMLMKCFFIKRIVLAA